MDKYIFDEKNGQKYELHGDYYLPCLKLPDEEQQPIGIWSQRHRRYLKEHHKAAYAELLTSGKLSSYLAEIDCEAEEMFSQLVKQMVATEGITEKPKADDMTSWIGKMNSIRNRVREIVNDEIIYA